ncbi:MULTISPECIES: ATP-dependent DNA helicase [Roseivirga]|uniref:ATP-dependent endonuclease n=1 Tax=Roseivirga spongicola TaxID=333140 RepID=A0A150XAJ6_9BACT|nr:MULTISPECIES: AAA family ATPase [Roseivirga]KYG75692.1 ATP-dependent endonuclease [Roseivirga spongicola]MBO6494786.1 AAA family ATPase [Roseivirga sp.]MBO6662458.1 AAA family ATPase [Roseivirga sp.]MBO6909978.1 AAA family ATPase [Roseivirga sp.]WPZ10744.1 AAA family ATPase [Roseivirga spongicola]
MAKPSEILIDKFPFEPTEGQKKLFRLFDSFLLDDKQKKPVLVLRGYAGTGKTTVVSAVVKMLPFFKFKYVLMAPTGRAAKVMSGYSKRTAFTIHKKVFQQTAEPGGGLEFKRQSNYHKNTLFIVDEASMISNASDYGKKGLLSDLIDYVFSQEGNRLLLIGDTAQLPPVGTLESPALERDYLQGNFRADVQAIELTEVMRQDIDSGILFNATKLRNELAQNDFKISLATSRFTDVFKMTGEKLEDGLRYAYDKFGVENTAIICRSNKNAVQYNQYIRRAIQYREDEIEAGDILMIVRNNYHFLPENTPAGFLANGDFVEVMKISRFEELYDLRFANLTLRLLDYPDQEPFEAKVVLDTLYSAEASLNDKAYKNLYDQVVADYADLSTKAERIKAIKNDPYLNALQIKFAYALTCHKSQGGQWQAVFVDQGYLTEEMVNHEYLRWLYTAITRATKELYLVNFNKDFFS